MEVLLAPKRSVGWNTCQSLARIGLVCCHGAHLCVRVLASSGWVQWMFLSILAKMLIIGQILYVLKRKGGSEAALLIDSFMTSCCNWLSLSKVCSCLMLFHMSLIVSVTHLNLGLPAPVLGVSMV